VGWFDLSGETAEASVEIKETKALNPLSFVEN
jgi:hypothetical protein